MDAMFRRIEQIKQISASIKRRHAVYSDIAKLDDAKTTDSMKALRKAPDPGGKIQKIGFIIFWIPEPTGITNAIGAPMILAGRFLEKKYNGATIKDIGKAAKDNQQIFSHFKDTVM
ncbi:MAG TPA: hypothetical protein VNK44_08835 [Candidatus Nitrosotenuis sp.]|nr:hypothetical protein [Candidatus Nitrosotenuis sp.]